MSITSHATDLTNPLLIDAFLYNGEPIAALRLRHLSPYVDRFFITEARYTFSGKKKVNLFFERDAAVFEPYLDRITFLVVEEFPEKCKDAWSKESYQRNYAQPEIKSFAQARPYIVMCCDVDELPNTYILTNARGWYDHLNHPCHMSMAFYYYNFNWRVPGEWHLQFLINDRGFKMDGFDVNHTRQVGAHNRPCIINNAGWHFSYFSSWEDIRRKLESFSHTEYDFEQYKSKENIVKSIANGLDLFHRGTDLVRVTSEEQAQFPNGWKELQMHLWSLQS